MQKIFYNKLIRDNVPEKINSIGSKCEVRKLSEVEYEKELLKKAQEEVSELVEAGDRGEFISELADVMDVMDEILKLKSISKKEIKNKQEENFKKKGGFKKRLFLIWSSNDGYKSSKK